VVSATDPHGRNLGFLDPAVKDTELQITYLVTFQSRIHFTTTIDGEKKLVEIKKVQIPRRNGVRRGALYVGKTNGI
jgi:hypothetical protein